MSSEHILANVIRNISQNAEDAGKPTTLEFGEVVSEEYAPLEIRIHDKLVLEEAFLELTNAVKDHWVDIEVYWETIDDNDLSEFQENHYTNIEKLNENVQKYNQHRHPGCVSSTTGEPDKTMTTVDKRHTSHLHNIAGRKRMLVYNGLHKGEKVVLLRMRGGQKYLVLDRITPHIVGGEWQTHSGAVLDDQETKPFTVTDGKVLAGWKEGATSESKWPNAARPAAFQPGAPGPEHEEENK